jgi:serine/threonine-protein kinase
LSVAGPIWQFEGGTITRNLKKPKFTRRLTMFRKTLLALFVAVPCLIGSAYANQYAAIAYSSSTGNAAYSWGACSLEDAETSATEACDGTDAVIVTWSRNCWCALAVGDDGAWGTGSGNTQEEAESTALANCSSDTAHIQVSVFSGTCDGG